MTQRMTLPQEGLPRTTVLDRLRAYGARDLPWGEGRAWGFVYYANQETWELAEAAYTRFLHVNALDPTAYPSALQIEREVLQMMGAHLSGGEEAVGAFTSGGTESIMLAVKTARDRARALHPEIEAPEIIVPVTAHAAFHKAAHYLDVTLVPVPVDPERFEVDPEAVRAAITPRTILLVGSASGYTHGTVDPIPALGRLALEHNVLLHVDGCIGGFLLQWFRKLGEDVTPFDFSVPGVTSISMDLHKHGFAPKGASVIFHRDRSLREHQIFACARWTGYSIVNTTVQSTKSLGPVAAAWAVLNFLGEKGYLDIAARLLAARDTLVEGIDAIDGLRVLGRPQMPLIAIASARADVFALAEAMKKRGWYVQAQPGFAQCPPNLHLLVSNDNADACPQLLADLRACVASTEQPADDGLTTSVAQALAAMDPSQVDASVYPQLLAMAGIRGGGLPDDMSAVNRLLDALSPEWKEWLLVRFVNELFV